MSAVNKSTAPPRVATKEIASRPGEAIQETTDYSAQSLPVVPAICAPGPAPLLPFDGDNIPDSLKANARWAPWKAVWSEKRQKYDKIPHLCLAPHYGISTAKPDRWGTFAQALKAYTDNPSMFAGLGYVMTGQHDVVGIDLDNCVDLEHPEPSCRIADWALDVVDQLGSYSEVSPSGKGLRIMVLGGIPNDWTNHKVGIEVYGGHQPRFLTLTGRRLRREDLYEVTRPDVTTLEHLAAQYAKSKTTTDIVAADMPDLLDESTLPSLDSLPLPPGVVAFLTSGERSGDRSSALNAAGVSLYAAGLNDAQVFSLLVSNAYTWEAAAGKRQDNDDKALMYLWKHHCLEAKAKAASRAGSADDFEDMTQLPVSPEQQAEQAAVRARNEERAARIAQTAIDKAMAPKLEDLICIIDSNDLIDLPPGELVAVVLLDLVKAQLGGVDEENVLKRLKDATGYSLKALRGDLTKARRKGPDDNVARVSSEWPVPTARALVQQCYSVGGEMAIRRWQDEFLVWNGMRYQAVSTEDVRAAVYRLFEIHQVDVPGRGPVDNTVDALKALVNVPSTLSMPGWISGVPPAPMRELIVVRNGLLHVPSQTLFDHDPKFFTVGSVDVEFDAGAPRPALWLKFLGELFPSDPESITALQQWFGYLLTPDTSQQKMLMCVGPKRSGKGTIARVLRALLGEHNCAGPTLAQLGRQFGLQGLIGKSLALISDARVSGAADLQAVSENMLRVTGEDAVSVERKGTTDWVGYMTTRFALMSNTLPAIIDAGGAVASRFIVIKFTQSFTGHEDTRLTDKLMAELPGILLWALDGLKELQRSGAFLQPQSGLQAVEELLFNTTPLLGFFKDSLAYDPTCWVSKEALYESYRAWCREGGMKFTNQKNLFFSELYANSDGRLASCEPRVKGSLRRLKAVRGARFADGVAEQIPILGGDLEGIFSE